jgi:hypothetical protein
MANLLVASDFNLYSRQVPDIAGLCQRDDFYQLLIEKESECLSNVLGECLYDDLKANMEFDAIEERFKVKDNADDRWKYLVYGHKYQYNNNLPNTIGLNFGGCNCGCNGGNCDKHWEGLLVENIYRDYKYPNGRGFYTSLIIDYVYYFFLIELRSSTTITGETIVKAKNTLPSSSIVKEHMAWNSFVTKTKHCSQQSFVSLFTFLRDHSDLFPNWSPNKDLTCKDITKNYWSI